MTDLPNEPNGPAEHNTSADPNTQASSQQQAPSPDPNRRLVDAVRAAFRKGAEDARKAADQAGPTVKSLAAQTAYGIAYGLSFGAVFPFTLAERMAPECMRSGWKAGAKEGRESADQMAAHLKKQSEEVPPIVAPPEAGTAS